MEHILYPCLWFDGNAKQAAEFYNQVFDDSRIISASPIVVMFELEGKKFMGLNGGPHFKINPSISFFVLGESQEEINRKWEMLIKDGKVLMPLMKYPWNESYGWCQDQFGVSWQLMMGRFDNLKDKIIPSLMFTQSNAGKAEEAMQFYCKVFAHSSILEINRYAKGEGEEEGLIKHARFILEDQPFTILESTGPHPFTFNEAISWVVECDSQDQIDRFWTLLTEGGKESMCGWLKDRYGVSWQIVPKILKTLLADPAKAPKVTQAFMKMKKFDISALITAGE
ncbi:MAG: VOC family protein [Bacteroidota bacterium]|nr:VOC family protein [Bacteroidota bacterium]